MQGQDHIFSTQAADGYFERNFCENVEAARLEKDRLLDIHMRLNLAPPNSMLEIGCMTGVRLEAFRRQYDCQVFGIEPSRKAIGYGKKFYPKVDLRVGVASELPYGNGHFDCIVLGNFLSWVDRLSIFKVAYHVDRVLRAGGIVYVMDFDSSTPHVNKYVHNKNCYTYKMDHCQMFLWSPQYYVVYKEYYLCSSYDFKSKREDCTIVTVLRKNLNSGFFIKD